MIKSCRISVLLSFFLILARAPESLTRTSSSSYTLEVFNLVDNIDDYGRKAISPVRILKINEFGRDKTFVCEVLFKDKKHILKEIPPYCSDTNFLQASFCLRDCLRENGIPVPVLISTKQNKRYITKKGYSGKEKVYLLEEFMDGKSWSKKQETIESMAFMLGNLHRSSASAFEEISEKTQIYQRELLDLPRKNIFELATIITGVAIEEIVGSEKALSTSELESLENFIHECQTRLERIEISALQKGYNLISIPIHGDYNPTNILFDQKNQVSGVIDFDNCCITNPIHDVGTALLHISYFSFEKEVLPKCEGLQHENNLRNAKIFLDSYFQSAPVKPEQVLPYIEEVAEAVAIQLSTLYLIKGIYTKFSHANELFQHVESARSLIKQAFEAYMKVKTSFSIEDHVACCFVVFNNSVPWKTNPQRGYYNKSLTPLVDHS